MTTATRDPQGLLILPYLRIQNANAISSPMTHGFPSLTAFLGLMWALDRKLAAAGIPLVPEKIGVICHGYEEQVNDGYVRTFRLTRNPVDKDGSTAAIVEEGRIHLDITLVFQVDGGDAASENHLLFQESDERRREVAWQVRDIVGSMRVAGGTVLPPGKRAQPQILAWPDTPEEQAKEFRKLRRRWLPGFALVSRDDLLQRHWQTLREREPASTVLDAWLDLSRFNYRSERDEQGKVEWKHDRPAGGGWIVPIPAGYAALSPLYEGGKVANARDGKTPFRFVEGVYSIGQWISPHRLRQVQDLFWWPDYQPDAGLYRCRNGYTPSETNEDDVPASSMPPFENTSSI
ncbi:MAG: type I-F CRISPR-associated protein Csy2 [Pigmentiphaga sp.]|nr:type I-F CRISPR-associated protein Csy2 [Pigmentiphaga sp.]